MTKGDILKKIIEDKGTSIYKIAKETGVNRQTIANYIDKNNMIAIDKAQIIAQYLGISIDYMLTGEIANLEDTGTNNDSLVNYLKEKIEELEKKNSRLENENGYYKGLLDKNGIDYSKAVS